MTCNCPLDNAQADDFDALLLPGGALNPDQLRTMPAAVEFVKDFFAARKPVAAICHAPWTLIEANVVSGRTLTSWPSIKTDLRNAGADWVDREVVEDANLVTSRKPDDIPGLQRKDDRALRSRAPHRERPLGASHRAALAFELLFLDAGIGWSKDSPSVRRAPPSRHQSRL